MFRGRLSQNENSQYNISAKGFMEWCKSVDEFIFHLFYVYGSDGKLELLVFQAQFPFVEGDFHFYSMQFSW